MSENNDNVTQLEPTDNELGILTMQVNLDNGQIGINFSNQDTLKLFHQMELPMLVNPFFTGCMIAELRRRKANPPSPIIVPKGAVPPPQAQKAAKEIFLKIFQDPNKK